MNAQTINTAAQFTINTKVSPLSQKKAVSALTILGVGISMMMFFAAMWMPTLMMMDVVLTVVAFMGVMTSSQLSMSSVTKKAAQSLAVLAVGSAYALVSSVLYTIFTF